MKMKDAEKLRLLATFIKDNTKLPIDVEEFLLESASRAESWGGNLPYKPSWWDNMDEDKIKDVKVAHNGIAGRIFKNMDKWMEK
jgi:hypothetical protein